MNADTLLTHFERIAEAPDVIPRLRRFILDLAVCGKLDTNQEDEAVEAINASESLINMLPLNWRTLNFARHFDIEGGNQPPKSQFLNEPKNGYIRLFQIRDLGGNPVPTYIPTDSTARLCKKGDILIGRYGASVGKIFWAQDGAYNVALAKFIFPQNAVLPHFAFLLLKSDFFQSRLIGATRSAQAGFNKGDLAGINLPIPPLPEQHRIVDKVDELMALCDRLDAAKAERETRRDRLGAATLHKLNNAEDAASFRHHANFALNHLPQFTTRPEQIAQLRQTILNLAVRGKLVPQDPNDEPAATLLKKIQEEKERLIEGSKERRRKTGLGVDKGGVPFAVPLSWKWAILEDLVIFGPQNGLSPIPTMDSTSPKALTLSATTSGKFEAAFYKHVSVNHDKCEAYWLSPNDLLFQRGNTREYVGIAAIYSGPIRTFLFPDLMIRVRISVQMSVRFIHMASISPYARNYFAVNATGASSSMPKINQDTLTQLSLPVPPLAEQHRIVTKVDELMALCDRLEAQLTTGQTESRRLLEATLQEALAGDG